MKSDIINIYDYPEVGIAMRRNIIFVGEENKINNELYQLLNWRFEVTRLMGEPDSFEEIDATENELVLVSMVGKAVDYREWFEALAEYGTELPIVTISTESESAAYERFYETKQFHKILRPVTGRSILAKCRAIVSGEVLDEDEEGNARKNEKPHILVVDDNAMVLRNIKGILEQDYSVAVAPSGVHAFISIGKKMPDLILLDYEMPEMNGKQVLLKIRDQEEYADIPVVFLTSMDTREIVIELLALQPAGYILKPVDSQMLLDRIEDIIGK